ncbi:hypothetical protein [Novosphingopyxis iocasae]|uniref:hypothetical protein n=1 Tax=Novosphingopyxis iocasae TaxID=2762729 RepID=UPI001650FBAB|nr:hypothetical protein [Novosphingopyxis iocasae]
MRPVLLALSSLALTASLAACGSTSDTPAAEATAETAQGDMTGGTEVDPAAATNADEVVLPDESADVNASVDARAPEIAIDSPSATIDASGVRADPGSVRVNTPDAEVRTNGR